MTAQGSTHAGEHEVQVTFTVQGLDDELHVLNFNGSEALSSLYAYSVDLACREADLDFSQVVGQQALLTISRGDEVRNVQGVVSSFQQQQRGSTFTLYDATLQPRAFRMENRVDCRIFQDLSMKQVVSRVLEQHNVANRWRCRGNQEPEAREYCVQYRETDWNFVCRLLEEEGYTFFWEHTDSSHTMVISNDRRAHEEISGESTLQFGAPSESSESRERIMRMSYAERVVPGRVALRDYNFQMPHVDLSSDHESGQGEAELEVYDYPGVYVAPEQGQGLSEVRQQENEVRRRGGSGASDCARLAAGFTFTLDGHHQSSLNEQEYLVTSLSCDGTTQTDLEEGRVSAVCDFASSFSYIPAEVHFRPSQVSSRPRVMGSQTAVVVGPDGQEIHTNEQGQVKVQFHWDRLGRQDEQSSCWVRVAQPWAGDGYGFVFIPRIGNEVVVEFLEGDPDRPLVTGSVYHVQNPPPLDLPAEQSRSTIKSRSTPDSDGFNEIRFEDQAGAEELYTHAQRNQTEVVRADHSTSVGNDQSRTVKQNRTATIQEGDDKITVSTGSRTVVVSSGNIKELARQAFAVTAQTRGVHIVGRGDGVHVTGDAGPGVSVQGRGEMGVDIGGNPQVKLHGQQMIREEAPKIDIEATTTAVIHVDQEKIQIHDGVITIIGGVVNIGGRTCVNLQGGVGGGKGTASLNEGGVQIKGALIKLNAE